MFVVSKASNEQIDRHQINQTKTELRKKFSNQTLHLADLKLIWAGESELIMLTGNLRLRAIHINLLYALVELHREAHLELVELDSLKFRIT